MTTYQPKHLSSNGEECGGRFSTWIGRCPYYHRENRLIGRFVNLCIGDRVFSTEDSRPDDSLPMELEAWEDEVNPPTSQCLHSTNTPQRYDDAQGLILSTPSDIRVGPFARECQISHVVGRVIRHVFDPSTDANFQKEEALRLERTLNAFLPLLMEQEKIFGLFCAAMSLCSR